MNAILRTPPLQLPPIPDLTVLNETPRVHNKGNFSLDITKDLTNPLAENKSQMNVGKGHILLQTKTNKTPAPATNPVMPYPERILAGLSPLPPLATADWASQLGTLNLAELKWTLGAVALTGLNTLGLWALAQLKEPNPANPRLHEAWREQKYDIILIALMTIALSSYSSLTLTQGDHVWGGFMGTLSLAVIVGADVIFHRLFTQIKGHDSTIDSWATRYQAGFDHLEKMANFIHHDFTTSTYTLPPTKWDAADLLSAVNDERPEIKKRFDEAMADLRQSQNQEQIEKKLNVLYEVTNEYLYALKEMTWALENIYDFKYYELLPPSQSEPNTPEFFKDFALHLSTSPDDRENNKGVTLFAPK